MDEKSGVSALDPQSNNETSELDHFACGQNQPPLPWFSSLQCAFLLSLLQVHTNKEESLLLDWDRVRVFDREIAQMFLNMTKSEKEAQVFFLCPHLSHLS